MMEEGLRRQLAEAQEIISELRKELAETSRGLLALDMELEDRVAERTAELEAANRSLKREIDARERAEKERERLLVTEREARKLAEEAVRKRDEFISVAAHELKTPVTSLRGYAQVLLRQYERTGALDPERVTRAMEAISQQTNKLTSLTEQLLNLSRIEMGKLKLAAEETDLAALVGEVVGRMRLSNPARVIECRADGRICAFVDPLRVEQVVTNLIDNALKFSPPGSPVEVEAGKNGEGWARIIVRDHGIGIPEDMRSHVFERFFQAHPERHYGGMGIGLSVVRQVVEMHGGTIALGQPEDGGSVFVVCLPTCVPETTPSGPTGGEC